MTFDKLTNYIWTLRLAGEAENEFARFVDQCNDTSFLRDYFDSNKPKLGYFNVSVNQAVTETIEDIDYLEDALLDLPRGQLPDNIFEALGEGDSYRTLLQRNKAKRRHRKGHDCWIRIYAIKLEVNHYIITGGAIKLTRATQEGIWTQDEVDKLDKCRNFLQNNNVHDEESLKDLLKERE